MDDKVAGARATLLLIKAGCETSERTSAASARLIQSIQIEAASDGFVVATGTGGSSDQQQQQQNQYHTSASGAAASDGGCCVVC
jgi:hypothetical protein